jgi:hypothetical protein
MPFYLFKIGTSDTAARYRPMQLKAAQILAAQVLTAQGDAMFNFNIRMPIMKMAAAALVAGLIVFVTAGAPKVNDANASANAERPTVAAKGSACSLQGWPNFERNCQFDLRKPENEARKVRVLALH